MEIYNNSPRHKHWNSQWIVRRTSHSTKKSLFVKYLNNLDQGGHGSRESVILTSRLRRNQFKFFGSAYE